MITKTLSLNFHGRVIDHLGIQMYQSPTAAIAEMVSNAWDADSENVLISLPAEGDADPSKWTIVIKDDGHGMTFDECQKHFLTVGFDRREGNAKAVSRDKGRPLMGRKGIGKFAGFGIATQIEISTISKLTGEQTVFVLDLDVIRESDGYVQTNALQIAPNLYSEPNPGNTLNHGTTITLRNLKLNRRVALSQFRRSMARRFMVNQQVDTFLVKVNQESIPADEDFQDIEFSFPKDYDVGEVPEGLIVDADGWGTETISNGHEVKWRILFKKETIKEEGHQGIAVFAHKKLAQRPGMFNITGGLTTQTGPEYMTGAVIADYVDELNDDVISTERQRLNWEHPELEALEFWGQDRIRKLLAIWKKRRGDVKLQLLNEKISGFRTRINDLGFDGKTVETALRGLASIEKISTEQFQDLGNAVLTAWEGGRLKHLIHLMSQTHDMNESDLLKILIEADTIQALHTAESVKAKLEAIKGLEKRINERQLENAVRDYIAKHPWLVSPEWETFAIEKNVQHIISKGMAEAKKAVPIKNESDDPFKGRVDLILSSGTQLLVMEFMRPGLKVDADHVNRFEAYINTIKEELDIGTGTQFKTVTGYLVADKFLEGSGSLRRKVITLKDQNMFAMPWPDLLARSKTQWKEFLDHLVERAPNDSRMQAVKTSVAIYEAREAIDKAALNTGSAK